jgi:hypothetical protein
MAVAHVRFRLEILTFHAGSVVMLNGVLIRPRLGDAQAANSRFQFEDSLSRQSRHAEDLPINPTVAD